MLGPSLGGAAARLASVLALAGAAPVIALIGLALFGGDMDATRHLVETRLFALVTNTLVLGALTAAGVTALGVGAAWLVAAYRFPGRNMFDWALMLPLAAPAYVLAYAYAELTAAAGPLQSWLRAQTGLETGAYWFPEVAGVVGASFVFAFCLYPYVYVIARRAFAEQAAPLSEAARTLGRGPLRAFFEVAVPLARPAMVAGGALAVIETVADFGAVAHLGAPTLTVGVMRAWSLEGAPAAAARLGLIVLVVSAALYAVERGSRGRGRIAAGPRITRTRSGRKLPFALGWLAAAACAFPIVMGLLIPGVRLAMIALDRARTAAQAYDLSFFEAIRAQALAEAALNSATLAGAAAVIAAAIALGASARARAGAPFARFAAKAAAAGYAVPGAVAAMGALTLLGMAQRALNTGWEQAFGAMAPFTLVGGIAALLLAYQTRFAAAALGPVSGALERIPRELDGAARSLGAPPAGVLARVHWPLARAGVMSAALLVFVEVMKELPATMILSPSNFRTLAVAAHNYAADERLAQAAAPALAIPLITIFPLAVAARAMRRTDAKRA